MVKTPIKQIYLLLIVIVGIISLSVYSTYALFTYDKETGEVVNINILDSLHVDINTKEYKRVFVKGNSLTYVDIDINNPSDTLLCYGIWYQVVSDKDGIYVYKANNESITSGSLEELDSRRVSIVIFNDNREDINVNIGINNASDLLCTLNLDENKHLITDVYTTTYLDKYLLSKVNIKEETKESEYKELEDYLIKKDMDKLMVSSHFEFNEGVFTLLEPYEIEINDIRKDELYYFILEDNNREMYKITSVGEEYITTTKYIGFIDSVNGIVKYEDNYEYYGANPDNYICLNDKDNNCELYRIVGLFKNDNKYNVKIVRNDYLGVDKYSLNDNNLFMGEKGNNIYDYLNKYYEDLSDKTKEQVIEYEYKIDYNNQLDDELIDIYNYESVNKYKLNVGLLNLTDYLYASNCNTKKFGEYDLDCNKNNWLYKYDNEMLINRLDTNNEDIFMIGDNFITKYDRELNVRPLLYLDSDLILVKGDGTINNPFIIR